MLSYLIKSNIVSVVVISLVGVIFSFAIILLALNSPGLIIKTKIIPRITADIVVEA